MREIIFPDQIILSDVAKNVTKLKNFLIQRMNFGGYAALPSWINISKFFSSTFIMSFFDSFVILTHEC